MSVLDVRVVALVTGLAVVEELFVEAEEEYWDWGILGSTKMFGTALGCRGDATASEVDVVLMEGFKLT